MKSPTWWGWLAPKQKRQRTWTGTRRHLTGRVTEMLVGRMNQMLVGMLVERVSQMLVERVSQMLVGMMIEVS